MAWASRLPARSASTGTKIQARKDKVLATLRGGIKGLLNARKVTILTGTREARRRRQDRRHQRRPRPTEITADKIILAAGSMPSRIPGWPTDLELRLHQRRGPALEDTSRQLLIVGGGVIGCEFACMMRAFGVEVTIVEMMPQAAARTWKSSWPMRCRRRS